MTTKISSSPSIATSLAESTAEILSLEEQRYDAMVAGNIDLMATFLHPDVIYVHSNAERDSRAGYLAKCRSGALIYEAVLHPVESILIKGDVAFVSGWMRATIRLDGKAVAPNNRSLAVWLQEGGVWRLIAFEPTPLQFPLTATS